MPGAFVGASASQQGLDAITFIQVWAGSDTNGLTLRTGTTTNEVDSWRSSTLQPEVWQAASSVGAYLIDGDSTQRRGVTLIRPVSTGTGTTNVPLISSAATAYPTYTSASGGWLAATGLRCALAGNADRVFVSAGHTVGVTFDAGPGGNNGKPYWICGVAFGSATPGSWALQVSGGVLSLWLWNTYNIALLSGIGSAEVVTAVLHAAMLNGRYIVRVALSRYTTGILVFEFTTASVPEVAGRFVLFSDGYSDGNFTRVFRAMDLPFRLSDTEMRGLCDAMHTAWKNTQPEYQVLVWTASHAARVLFKVGTTTNEVAVWRSGLALPDDWMAAVAASGTYTVESALLPNDGLDLDLSKTYRTGTANPLLGGNPIGVYNAVQLAPLFSGKSLAAVPEGRTYAIRFSLLSVLYYTNPWYPMSYGVENFLASSPNRLGCWNLIVDSNRALLMRYFDESTGGWSVYVTLSANFTVPLGSPTTVVLHLLNNDTQLVVRAASSLFSTGVKTLTYNQKLTNTNGKLCINSDFSGYNNNNSCAIHRVVSVPRALSDAQMQGLCDAMV